jgi:hypothetical protein
MCNNLSPEPGSPFADANQRSPVFTNSLPAAATKQQQHVDEQRIFIRPYQCAHLYCMCINTKIKRALPTGCLFKKRKDCV